MTHCVRSGLRPTLSRSSSTPVSLEPGEVRNLSQVTREGALAVITLGAVLSAGCGAPPPLTRRLHIYRETLDAVVVQGRLASVQHTVRSWSSFSYQNMTRSGHCTTSVKFGSYWSAGDADGTQSYSGAIASSKTSEKRAYAR